MKNSNRKLKTENAEIEHAIGSEVCLSVFCSLFSILSFLSSVFYFYLWQLSHDFG